jgi:hypothetical protein
MTVRTVTKQSESYFKVGVLGVWSNLFNFGFPDITSEGAVDISQTGVDVIRGSLDNHFDSAVQDIADEAGQAVTMGDVVSGKAEANALDPANKDNMFCALVHPIHTANITLRIKVASLCCYSNARLFVRQGQSGAINKVHR